MNDLIKDLILNYKTQEAFWALADGVMNDIDAYQFRDLNLSGPEISLTEG